MADDLMDFSYQENKENSFCADDDNVDRKAPGLVNSPVIVNSILKQSTKDNLIQLYTPVQKPTRAPNRKVRFGSDKLLETPTVKKPVKTCENTKQLPVPEVHVTCEAEKEEWIERTSVLTKQDHVEYTQYAREFVAEIVTSLPIKDNDGDNSGTSADSGIEEGPNETADSAPSQPQEPPTDPSIREPPSNVGLEENNDLSKLLQNVDLLLESYLLDNKDEKSSKDQPKSVIKETHESPAALSVDVKEPEIMEAGQAEAQENKADATMIEEEKAANTAVVADQTAMGAEHPLPIPVKSGEDSDEEFMSAGEEMEVDEPVTPVKRQDAVPTPEPYDDAMEDMEVDEAPTPAPKVKPAVDQGLHDIQPENTGDSPARSPPKVAYNLDFDNLDTINPFASKASVANSPDPSGNLRVPAAATLNKVKEEAEKKDANVDKVDSDKGLNNSEAEKKKVEHVQETDEAEKSSKTSSDKQKQKTRQVQQSMGQENKEVGDVSTDSAKVNIDKEVEKENGCQSVTEKSKLTEELPHDAAVEQPDQPASPERTPPKVGYNLDFLNMDNLEDMDPFATKKTMMNSPEIKSSKSIIPDSKAAECESAKEVKVINNDPENGDMKKKETKVDKNKETKTDEVKEAKTSGKATYNADMDPFKPSKQVVNSPDLKEKSVEADDEDPFQPKKQIVNSPEIKQQVKVAETSKRTEKGTEADAKPEASKSVTKGDKVAVSNEVLSVNKCREDISDIDPCKPEKQTQNSPDKTVIQDDQAAEETDPFKPKKQMLNSPVAKQNEEQFQPDIKNDPFKPQTQIANSPTKENKKENVKAGKHSVKKKTENRDTHVVESLDDIDPFKPKKQMVNSPVKAVHASENVCDAPLENIDPYKPKKQMANSPAGKNAGPVIDVTGEDNPNKSKQQIPSSPVGKPLPIDNIADDAFDDIDPFKPKKQMLNSPVVNKTTVAIPALPENLDEIDPFKPKKQMANSPVGKKNEPTKELDEITEDDDPFKPKKQMANSPVGKKTEPIKELDEITEDDDPFKPKKQMANSPVGKKTEPIKELDEITEDPFKPKKQMANSPVGKKTEPTKELDEITENEDPFKPKKQMANSPVGKKSEPIKELDEITEDDDPFKPKKQMANSPVGKKTEPTKELDEVTEDDDPFKPKKQMANSPVGKKTDAKAKNGSNAKEVNTDTKAEDADIKDSFEDLDPFSSKKQIPNSPPKTVPQVVDFADLNPFGTKTKLANSPAQKGSVAPIGAAPVSEDVEEEEEFFEVQGVTRRGEQPEGSKVGPFDDLGIDDSQFVPASQVFNDPNVWDMLESYGSSGANSSSESSLSRMSLYVKFDPLVDAAPVSRRISIRPAQLEKMKEYGLDDTLLLLGTPPKKRRQSMSTSLLRMTPSNPKGTPVGKKKILAPEPLVLQPGPVDLMMACSPEAVKQDEQKLAPPAAAPIAAPVMSLMTEEEETDEGLFQELKYTDGDLRSLKNSLQMELQGLMLAKEKEWYHKEQNWKQQQEQLIKEIRDLREEKKEMLITYNMFERTIVEISGKQKSSDDKCKELEEQNKMIYEDLSSLEKAFSDLHKRYEKARGIIESIHENEETLKNSLKKAQDSEKECKKEAEEKIKRYAAEAAKLKQQQQEAENIKDSQIKVLNVKLQNLQKNLDQKIDENKQLTELCEDLLSKVPQ